MSEPAQALQRVIKLVQELLIDEPDRSTITPALISSRIEQVVSLKPEWGIGLDREAVCDELIRRFSLWIGNDTTLKSDEGHLAWLNAERKHDWHYWQRYRDWIEAKLSWTAADALDRSTDTVLGLLEDPVRSGTWDRRGLVVGHVQSGKTGQYTGLICKAADAGYKIVIVLAGMHNNLRAQTQIRLDEGFLGYATGHNVEIVEFVGAGHDGRDANIKPNCATNRTQFGDFNTHVARHLAITPEQRPWLFVVKKNKTVLEQLLDWIEHHVADSTDSTGRRVVTRLPLLVIDDEADHASIDTGEQSFDESGKPDPEHEPKTINSRIRKLLRSFTRSAYVGFTATPFANIFIHEKGSTTEEGLDLFPSAFIINLAAPSNYVGPVRVFGLPSTDGARDGLPLIREIDDFQSKDGKSGWMPLRHPNGHIPLFDGADALPPSLRTAIYAFLLVCAIRQLRGQAAEHTSMLIHVTRFNSVQREVHRQVESFVRGLRQRLTRSIGAEEEYETLLRQWNEDFIPTSAAVRAVMPAECGESDFTWEQIKAVLPAAIGDLEVRMINGTAKDALDYEERRATGLKVIAIGGDKLARGLTLEGLCVSYFLRASKMYDTLMQMGRWFGYRHGYLDLSRLYTTDELVKWFKHITEAAEELREEFDLMAANGATPREYGLKVQSHSTLMVTSHLKMRTARRLMLSFSGQVLETTALQRDESTLQQNLQALQTLIAELPAPELNPIRKHGVERKWEGYTWSGVDGQKIAAFLRRYRTHRNAYKVNSLMLADFIDAMIAVGELTSWTVALIGGGEGSSREIAPGVKVEMLRRSADSSVVEHYSIGRLLSPRDETIDLDEPSWRAALALARAAWHADPARQQRFALPDEPNGTAIRHVRGFGAEGVNPHPERGLLLLYALDPEKAVANFPRGTSPVIAFGLSFPGSKSGHKVEYRVNNILWEQEYGPAD